MSEQYGQRLRQLQSLLEPGLRRMLLISFVLHLIVPVMLSGVLRLTHKTPQLPVYRVNLVNMPVKNPQAGRPDAAPAPQKKKLPEPEKPAAVKIPTKPAAPVKPVPAKIIPAAKKAEPAKKTAPKAETPKPETSAADNLQKRLAEIQARVERQKTFDALKAAIAAQQKELARPDNQAPVGEPDGSGDEIGLSSRRYIEGFIAEQWRLSPYQAPLDLEAEVTVSYSAEGKQGYWELTRKSGNQFFDDSVKKAIIRSKDLGYPLPAAGTFEIVFNLKDLQNR
jgi:hypothetical protein